MPLPSSKFKLVGYLNSAAVIPSVCKTVFDFDSELVDESRIPVGKIQDVMGPVDSPIYSLTAPRAVVGVPLYTNANPLDICTLHDFEEDESDDFQNENDA